MRYVVAAHRSCTAAHRSRRFLRQRVQLMTVGGGGDYERLGLDWKVLLPVRSFP